jgi:hypothetical protein
MDSRHALQLCQNQAEQDMPRIESIRSLKESSLLTLLILTFALWVVYLLGLAIYRLYLSPLARFPGPRLAALSNWYEFYYDVMLQGNFTFHIHDLHEQYGMSILGQPM